MNTRWSMTFILFFGLIGAILLTYAAITDLEKTKSRVIVALSFVSLLVAFLIVLSGLNNPIKILTILSTVGKGFSGAVLMLALTSAIALIAFFKLKHRTWLFSSILVVISLATVCALSRIYMITTRPALNSYNTMIMLLLLALLTVFCYRLKADDSIKTVRLAICFVALYGVSLFVFIVRIAHVHDRILGFNSLMTGTLAIVFWGATILTFLVPFAYLLVKAIKNKVRHTFLLQISISIGICLLSILINQMPAVEKGINNRIFF